MKHLLALLLLAHGLIHLMGFVKAFHFAPISQLQQEISKPAGIFWGIACLLFCATAVFMLQRNEVWWAWGLAAVIVSQVLIVSSWQDAKFGTVANAIVLLAVALGFAASRYKAAYKRDATVGLTRTASLPVEVLTEKDLAPLPDPVQRYLRYSGAVGQPKVFNFRVCFKGKIRGKEKAEWMPLQSEQYNFMDTPTRLFFMDATMKGLPVAGYHAFKDGDAMMDIRLLSLLQVQYQEGKEMDIAETVTFFNDMCCMAPATLIDRRIQWLETDGNKVKAAFTNKGITITAQLIFNDAGQLVNFISQDRYARGEDGSMQQLPWATPLQHYKTFGGRHVATYAETIYTYPDGEFVYAVFEMTDVAYNCTMLGK